MQGSYLHVFLIGQPLQLNLLNLSIPRAERVSSFVTKLTNSFLSIIVCIKDAPKSDIDASFMPVVSVVSGR